MRIGLAAVDRPVAADTVAHDRAAQHSTCGGTHSVAIVGHRVALDAQRWQRHRQQVSIRRAVRRVTRGAPFGDRRMDDRHGCSLRLMTLAARLNLAAHRSAVARMLVMATGARLDALGHRVMRGQAEPGHHANVAGGAFRGNRIDPPRSCFDAGGRS